MPQCSFLVSKFLCCSVLAAFLLLFEAMHLDDVAIVVSSLQ